MTFFSRGTLASAITTALFAMMAGWLGGSRADAADLTTSTCIYALDPSAHRAFQIAGATLTSACSAVVASNASDAFEMEGSAIFNLQNHSQLGIVGGADFSGQTKLWDTSSNQQVQPVSITTPADPLSSIVAPTTGTIVRSSPTNYDMNNKPANNTLQPGIYCGGLTVGNTNGITFAMNPGTYIIAGGGFTLNSLAKVNGTGVTVYNTASAGWGCSQSYSYVPMTISGQASVNLSAPTSGSLAGIVLFGDRTACSSLGSCVNQVNGGSTTTFKGALYFKKDKLLFSGATFTGGYLMLVADLIGINGTATVENTGSPFNGISVTVAPATITLLQGETQQFSATVNNSGNQNVTWALSPPTGSGTLSASGLYTAPATVSTTQTVTVTATSQADSTKSRTATITLAPLLAPSTLSFAGQPVGTTGGPLQVTLTNPKTTPISINSISITGDFAQSNGCGTSVAAGASCTISVFFTPVLAGPRTGTLTVSANGRANTVALSGTGTAVPAISFNPASLSFGNQLINAPSSSQTVTVTNTGSATLTIASITATGDFSQTNNCPASIAAGGTCSVTVVFTPTAAGARTGSITVSDNVTGSPHTVALSGTGTTAPAISFSPTSLNFGNQLLNTPSSSQTVIVTNTGSAALTISSITATADFSQTNNCPASVATGGTCTITVVFTPTGAGARAGSITVVDNATGSPQTIALTGTGTTAPAITFNPPSLSFGNQLLNTPSSSQTVIVTNTGSAALSITSIAASGDFSQTNTCPASIDPAATCAISVVFTPTAAGNRTGAITVVDNATGSPHTVALTGTGTTAPAITFNPTSLSFGNQVLNTASSSQTVTVTNTGSAALTITSITASGDFSQTNNCPASVDPAATCTITALFTPTAAAGRIGLITVVDNAAGSPHTVALSGTGTTAPAISFSPASLSFGDQVVTTSSSSQTVTVTNTGSAALAITSIAASGDFSQTNNCPASVDPAATCTITVIFTPTAAGARTGAITVVDNANSSPHTVALTGTGTVRLLSLSSTSLTFGNQLVNAACSGCAGQVVTVTNSGTAPVTITSILASGDFAQTNTCPAILNPAATCTITAVFNPTAVGTRSGTISVASNANGSPHTVSLTGTGTSTPGVGLSVTSLTFGDQPVGTTSAPQTVTLTNVSLADLNISSIAASAEFTQANTCPATLTAGSSCFIAIRFAPTASGSRTGSITITDDASGSPQVISLTGTASLTPVLSLSSSSLTFSSQLVGSASASQTITVTNPGAVAVTLSNITATGDYALTNSCGTSLAPNTSCNLTVTFNPTAVGTRAGAVTIVSTANGSPHIIGLTGTGIAPDFSVTPQTLTSAVIPGGGSSYAINSAALNGFTGTISWSVTGLPVGATGTFSPISVAVGGSTTLTITTPASIPSATFVLNIIGTSGSLTHSVPVTLIVTPPDGFTIVVPSAPQVQFPNGSVTYRVDVASSIGAVDLTVSGLPSGASASFAPTSVNGTGSSTLTVSVGSNTPAGTYSIAVTGTSSNVSHTGFVTLVVPQALSAPWSGGDLGAVTTAGISGFDPLTGSYIIAGSGAGISGAVDGFQFASQQVTGDFSFIGRYASAQNLGSQSQVGLVFREDLTPGAGSAAIVVVGGASRFSYRSTNGQSVAAVSGSAASSPVWFKLNRVGNVFSAYTSTDGMAWNQLGPSTTLNVGTTGYVGFESASAVNNQRTSATFDNTSLTTGQDFLLTMAPAGIVSGASIQYQVSVNALPGFSGTIALSVTGLPSGASASFSPASLASGISTLSITPAANTPAGSYPITVTGTSGTLVHTAAVNVIISGSPARLWTHSDVGTVSVAGGVSFSSSTFTVTASGADINGTADGMHYVYQPLTGDGTIIARVVSRSGIRREGVMIRQSLNGSAVHAFMQVVDNSLSFAYRVSAGSGTAGAIASNIALPYWVKLTRQGNQFTGAASADGITWTDVGTSTVQMTGTVYIGLAASALNNSAAGTVLFDNVMVTTGQDFLITVDPTGSFSGASIQYPVSVSALSGFSGNIALSATGLPSGATASFSPASLTSGTSTLTITPAANTVAGSYPITITGTSGTLVHNTIVNLVVSGSTSSSWTSSDVGNVSAAGNFVFNGTTFTITASGSDINGTADGMHYVYQPLSGDGAIVARVVSRTGIRRVGLMIRQSLDGSSPHSFMQIVDGSPSFAYRTIAGGGTTNATSAGVTLPYWLKLTRQGDKFTGSISPDGLTWTVIGTTTFSMSGPLDIGMAASALSNSSSGTTVFDNVSVTTGNDFLLSVNSSGTISNGSIQYAISVAALAGFNGTVTLNATGLPAGATASFGPASLPSGTSFLTLTPDASTPPGSYPITIVGVSGPQVHTDVVNMLVSGGPATLWTSRDVGSVSVAGNVAFNGTAFTITASGSDINGSSDGMHFLYQPLNGDGTIVARVVSRSGVRRLGAMIRQTLDGSSAHAFMQFVDGAPSYSFRSSAGGGTTNQTAAGVALPYWVRLVRSGNTFTGSISSDGATWTTVGTSTVSMNGAVYIGLAASSLTNNGVGTAVFDNVSLSTGADFLLSVSPTAVQNGSNLEYAVSAAGTNGFSGTIALSASGLPTGATATFTPSSIASTGAATLSVNPGTAANGRYPIVITATSGTLIHSQTIAFAVGNPITSPWTSLDVGNVVTAGNASVSSGTFTLNGAGAEIASTADAFQYVFQPLNGDGSITARLSTLPGSRRAGLMIRETLDGGSANVFVNVLDGLSRFGIRASSGANTSITNGPSAAVPVWLRMTRQGNQFTGEISSDGTTWTTVGTTSLPLAASVYIGMALTSRNTGSLATATFDNVSTVNGQDFLLTANPTGSIANGSIQHTINVSALGGFNGAVALSIGGLPSGATANFSPSSLVSGTSTLTVTPAANTAPGTYLLTITGTSGSVVHTTAVQLIVTATVSSLWTQSDIGSVGSAGSGSFSAGTFTISGAGPEIASTGDGFHYIYQPLNGDGSITARLVTIAGGRRAGLMIRETLDAGSAHAFVNILDGVSRWGIRASSGANTSITNGPSAVAPVWLRLTRQGSQFTGELSSDGTTWTSVGSTNVSMSATVYMGMAITSRDIANLATSTFDNVSVVNGQDFLLTANPTGVIATGSIQHTVSVTALGGFSGAVDLTIAGLPSGATASFSPSTLAAGSSTLTVTPATNTAPGTYPLTITGTSGTVVHVASLQLIVTATVSNLWTQGDIGAVGSAGSGNFTSGTFTISGAGAEIASTADAFHYVYQPLNGDGSITARLATLAGGRRAGLMIRETLDPGSTNAFMNVLDGVSRFGTRTISGANTSITNGPSASAPVWLRMTRLGNHFTGELSANGTSWTIVGTVNIPMTSSVYIGMAVTSRDIANLATPTFDNVTTVNGQDFLLTANPTGVIANGSIQHAVSVSALGGFNGAVALSVTGLPTGATASFSPASLLSGTSTLTVTPAANTTAGTYPLTITGTSGTIVHTTAIQFIVTATVSSLWTQNDIGVVGSAGSGSFAGGTFTITGAGAEISGTGDNFHFLYQPLNGDGSITARLATIPGGRRAGLMIRETLDAASSNALVAVLDGVSRFGSRTSSGANTSVVNGPSATAPVWLRLTRQGSQFTGEISADGTTWSTVSTASISMAASVYVGMAITSRDIANLATATFDNVTTAGVQNFTISASPTTQSSVAGGVLSYGINSNPLGGFVGNLAFSISGLPAGASATITPSQVAAGQSAILSIATSTATSTGTYPVTLTATNGSLVQTLNVNVVINAVDFSLNTTPSSQTMSPGGTKTYVVSVVPQGTFASPVDLSISGLPPGVGASFSPATISGSGISTLTLISSGNAPLGTATITVTAVSGTLTHSKNVSLTLSNTPDFSISSSTDTRVIPPGATAKYSLDIGSINGFNGIVDFQVGGLPSGASAVFSPVILANSGAVTLTVATAADTPAAPFTLNVDGNSGSLTHRTVLSLSMNSAADFAGTATPASRTIAAGGSATYTVNLTAAHGYTGVTTLSAVGLPAGATASFNPPTVVGGGTSVMTITTTSGTPASTSNVTINGTSGVFAHSVTSVSLTVNAAPDFSITAVPTSQPVAQGASTSFTLAITPLNGFAGTVNLNAAFAPSGSTVTFNPPTITGFGSTVMTVSVPASTPLGVNNMVVSATSGSLSHSVPLVVTVTPQGTSSLFTLSPPVSGPNVAGTAQVMTALLRDNTGAPIVGTTVQFTVAGPNTGTSSATTDANGVATYSFTGSAVGTDAVSASATVSGSPIQTNISNITWVAPARNITTTTVTGLFYPGDGTGVFNVHPSQLQPSFSQLFPSVAFNPPAGLIPGDTSGVGNDTRPLVDVTTNGSGNFNGTIVAQNSGFGAGVGPLTNMNSIFYGTLLVTAPGPVTFRVYGSDGFVFGVGNGAIRVSGENTNVPASGLTACKSYPVMGAYNQPGAPVPSTIVVNFPAAGVYGYEVDFANANGPLGVTLTVAGGTGDAVIAPAGSLSLTPITISALPAGQQQSFTALAVDAAGNPIASLPVTLAITGINPQHLTATTDATGQAVFTYTSTHGGGTDIAQAQALLGGMTGYSNAVTVPWSGSANQPPITSIGAPLTITYPNAAILNATATDDGLPSGSVLTYSWSVVSGPGTVTFGSTTALSTTASFSLPGTYTLRFTASDSQLTGSSTVSVTANPSGVGPYLSLTPPTAGPRVTGSSQQMIAQLVDGTGTAVAGTTVQFVVTGPNATAGTAVTDASGNATFSFTGAANGTDSVNASATFAGNLIESGTSTISWVVPTQNISSTTITGRFFAAPNTGGFVTLPGQQPLFTQIFPTVNFNPPTGTIPGNPNTGGVNARPMLDITTDINGNYTGSIIVGGNGHTAGVDDLFYFNAVFTGAFTVLTPGDITFNFFSDDGFILGIANGATRVSGALTSPPPSGLTPFESYPVMGAYNISTAPTGNTVTAHFPAAGTYPFELDYSECCAGELVLTMTASGPGGSFGIPSSGTLTISPNSRTSQVVGTPQTFTVKALDASGAAIANLPINIKVLGINAQDLTATTDSSGNATFTYTGTTAGGTDIVQANALITGMAAYSNMVSIPWNTGVNQAPTVSPGADQTITLPANAPLSGHVTDDGLPNNSTLSITWSVTTAPSGATVTFANPHSPVTTAAFSAAGAYLLRLTASDGTLASFAEVQVNVNPGASITGGWIASPVDHASISGLVPITLTLGTTLTSGTLTYSREGDLGPPVVLNSSTTGTGQVGSLDTTTLNNGTYFLTLTATNSLNQTQTSLTQVTIVGDYKPGRVTATITDLTVPAPGLPIQIQRTYDSLVRDKQGDFGYGWNLQYNMQTEVAANGDVTLTLNGRRRKFFFTPQANAVFTFFYTPQYTAEPGFYGSLVNTGDNCSGVLIRVANSYQCGVNTLGLYQASGFRYTDPYGRVYTMDAAGKIQSIQDLNANTLTIGANGITSSNGLNAPFVRDAQGRITKITDPLGREYNYTYSAAGELASVIPPALTPPVHSSDYSYDATHLITSEIDQRGNTAGSTEYYPDGKLKKVTSAVGDVTQYAYDLTTRTTTVTNPDLGTVVTVVDSYGSPLTVTDPLGRTTTYQYDASHNLTDETNPANEPKHYTYNANGFRTTVTDALSHTWTATYNAAGGPVDVSNPLPGQTQHVTYDASFRISQITDPIGTVAQFTYNSTGLPLTMKDARGNTSTYTNDAYGNRTSATDPLGRTTSYVYDTLGNLVTQTNPRAVVTSYIYDAFNRRTTMTEASGTSVQRTITYGYDGNNNKTSETNGRNFTTTYSYDSENRMIGTSYPDGTSKSMTYDWRGNKLTETDQLGRVTKYVYDLAGQLTSTTIAFGTSDAATTSHTYDPAGRKKTDVDPRGNTTTYFYDAAGRMTKLRDGVGNETQYGYNDKGERTSMIDAKDRTTTYGYDVRGRQTTVTTPDAKTVTKGYDGLGLITSVTDEENRTTAYEYDAANQLKKVTDALSQITQYTYDPAGNKLTQQDANIHTTTYAWDPLNRRTSRTLPLGQAEQYTYDPADNTATRTDFNGRTTTFVYDQLNRLLSRTPDASFPGQTESFTYTPTGQRATMTDASGTTTYVYTARDQVATKATPQGTLTYTYDLSGNVASVVSSNANGTDVAYAWDADNRLHSVTDNRTTGVTNYTYDETSQIANFTYSNGVVHAYVYDNRDRMTSLNVTKSGVIASYTQSFSFSGRKQNAAESTGRTASYTYDPIYRLTNESITGDPTTANNGGLTYALDVVGNRQSLASTLAALQSQSFTYDANDRLNTDTYDANGNTLTSNAVTYGYDYADRLTSATGGISIIYDGDGNRVSETVSGVTTKFLVDTQTPTGYAQVAEVMVGGNVIAQYTYGRMRISQKRGASVTYYGYDAGGSVRQLLDATGAVTDTYAYDAFGNTVARTGTTVNPFQYRAEQFDEALGMYYLRARWYLSTTGRFFTQDRYEAELPVPSGYIESKKEVKLPGANATVNYLRIRRYVFASSLNKTTPCSVCTYGYANADPINRMDPSGFDSVFVEGAEGPVQVDIGQHALTHFARAGVTREVGEAIVRNAAEEVYRDLIAGNFSPGSVMNIYTEINGTGWLVRLYLRAELWLEVSTAYPL